MTLLEAGLNLEGMEVAVEKNKTLMIEGEAEVKVISGEGVVFGKKIRAGDGFYVDLLKVAPLYVPDKCRIVVSSGRIWLEKGNTIPESWSKAIDELAKVKKPAVVPVLGGVDVGKTGFVTYAANKLFLAGYKVGIIDADTGQSDIGPPTTIGLGVLEEPVAMLTQVPFIDGFFIGLTSPAELFQRSVMAVARLTRKAIDEYGCDVVLVDTTGWVSGEGGRDLKFSKILTLNPSIIIAVEKEGELEHLLRYFEVFFRVLRVDAAVKLRPRSRIERRSIRASIYRKWLSNSTKLRIDLNKVKVAPYSFIFTGERLAEEELTYLSELIKTDIIYGELCEDRLLLLTDEDKTLPEVTKDRIAEIYGVDNVLLVRKKVFENLLVAFQSRRKLFEGLGIILDIDFKTRTINVLTNVREEDAEVVMFGYIKIDPVTFEERGWVKKWGF